MQFPFNLAHLRVNKRTLASVIAEIRPFGPISFLIGPSSWVLSLLIWGLFMGHSAGAESSSNEQCLTYTSSLEQKVATAGTYANFRGKDGSVSVETKQMINQSAKAAITYKDFSCSEKCPSLNRIVIFSSTPNLSLTSYSDKDFCLEMLRKTVKEPFLIEKSFKDISAFSDWFSEFSRGNGKDGKSLYDFCPKSCSPSYRSEIFLKNENSKVIRVKTEAMCGEARDKSENNYKLSSQFALYCKESPNL